MRGNVVVRAIGRAPVDSREGHYMIAIVLGAVLGVAISIVVVWR